MVSGGGHVHKTSLSDKWLDDAPDETTPQSAVAPCHFEISESMIFCPSSVQPEEFQGGFRLVRGISAPSMCRVNIFVQVQKLLLRFFRSMFRFYVKFQG